MIYLFLFIFGLAVGSFINVIALRYRPTFKLLNFGTLKLWIGGRSKCPICRKQLVWYELIPIFSFIFQKGKCRHCGHKLSLQYPTIEILSGLIFVFIPLSLAKLPLLVVGCWLLIFILFLLLSIIDFRQSIIPNQINLSLAVLGIIILVIKLFSYSVIGLPIQSFLGHYALLFDFNFLNNLITNNSIILIINHFFAAVMAMLMFGALIIFSRGRAMGWGDFKLVGALGLIFGWPDILMVLVLAFVIGALFSIILLIQKKKKIKEAVPFGPFLAIGASLTFFFGYQIIDWYFKLFGL